MPRVPVLLVLVVACVAAAGCASSARVASDEAALHRDVNQGLQVWGDVERLEFSKRMQVRLPARLVVADVTQEATTGAEEESAHRLTALLDTLAPDAATWTDVGSLHAFSEDRARASTRLEDLRAVAARQHADLMLVLERRETLVEGHNALAALKFLLVGFLFATEEDELRLTVRGAVVDVRNGLVYATFDDHRETELTTTVSGEDRAVRDAFRDLWAGSCDRLRASAASKLAAVAGSSAD
jgi:hypothetical protein